MVYWAILFYQDYRNHAKKQRQIRCFFEDKRLLSQFHDGIFETFGSKIRDEIPEEVAPVRTN